MNYEQLRSTQEFYDDFNLRSDILYWHHSADIYNNLSYSPGAISLQKVGALPPATKGWYYLHSNIIPYPPAQPSVQFTVKFADDPNTVVIPHDFRTFYGISVQAGSVGYLIGCGSNMQANFPAARNLQLLYGPVWRFLPASGWSIDWTTINTAVPAVPVAIGYGGPEWLVTLSITNLDNASTKVNMYVERDFVPRYLYHSVTINTTVINNNVYLPLFGLDSDISTDGDAIRVDEIHCLSQRRYA